MRKEYAVLAYFDFETEVKLKQFWRELYELGITDYGVIPKNRRPHITLADYQDIDVEKLSLMIEQYFTHQAQVTIQYIGIVYWEKNALFSPNHDEGAIRLTWKLS